MKVLALYDIHGNGDALEAVLADPRAAEPDIVVIGGERARFLGELPLTLTVDGILFCHASPRRDDELLTRLSSGERWSDALAGVSAELVVAGHTHQQDDRIVGGVRFINAGSVGLPYEGDGAARWLWVEDGVPELRRTEYDSAGAGGRMQDACDPAADSVRAALIEPVDPDVVARMFEERAGG
jgi:predicted phosphodiesterase